MSRVARRQQVDADQGAVQEVAVAAEVAVAVVEGDMAVAVDEVLRGDYRRYRRMFNER
jgi:hypothetical protein